MGRVAVLKGMAFASRFTGCFTFICKEYVDSISLVSIEFKRYVKYSF